ncbi:MAG: hypothetical protein HYW28_01460 [Rhodospirillales bacterium]|nr:hypothetical protein [Rhodospirillales bacterium]
MFDALALVAAFFLEVDRVRRGAAFHVLQLRPYPPDASGIAGDGSRDHGSLVVFGGNRGASRGFGQGIVKLTHYPKPLKMALENRRNLREFAVFRPKKALETALFSKG